MFPLFVVRRFLFLSFAVAFAASACFAETPVRQRECFDQGWRFSLGHATDTARDFNHGTSYFSYLAKTGFGDGPASVAFDDRAWRMVDLPHDWAVELPFDQRGKASHGFKAIGRLFPENSVGWYRKTFVVADPGPDRRVHLKFDGIYRAARVFINGFFLGEEPSGYLGTDYDITDYLRYGQENVVAVRVDASGEEGWYYEGAGIYRHVWLITTGSVRVAADGVWVRTAADSSGANVTVETSVLNEGKESAACEICQTIRSPDGKVIAETKSASREIPVAGALVTDTQNLSVPSPELWSLENPAQYTLVTTLRIQGLESDRCETPFGIRTLHFDPKAGFFLNGKRVELKGTNNHQDFAGVGTALPDALQEYRVRLLKEMGSNAWRCSHNPPNPELLDACDRLGMLVIDENRLMGASPYHLSQLERMIRRDRNHASVILWSIGNEEWAIEGNGFGARIAASMQRLANRLDPTRVATAAISGGWGGTSSVIQAAGVNYIKQADPDKQHADFPQQAILATEETSTQQTRGIYFTDTDRAHLAPQEDGTSGGNAELGWKYYLARPWAAGVFFWTGFDYRGEPTPFGWPGTLSQFGILDSCGFPKDGYYYLKSWWTDDPVLHVFPHWNWPDRVGQILPVTVNSNCDEVELLLNGSSLGRKPMPRDGHVSWEVKYTPGTLVARGFHQGRAVLVQENTTTGAADALVLTADRAELRANCADVAVVRVAITDKEGCVIPDASCGIRFKISGPGRIIGVGNGDPSCREPDRFVETVGSLPLGTWTPPAPAKTAAIVFETTFDRPVSQAGETVSLLLNALGSKQSAILNGAPLCSDAAPASARCEIALNPALLQPTGNRLRIEATPYSDYGDREALAQIHPAVLKFTRPAPAWRRTTFNGLALVLVQTTGIPGSIQLEAENESGPGHAKVLLLAK